MFLELHIEQEMGLSQVTGVGPLAALQQHINDPINTTIFSKAIVAPGIVEQPPCQIEPTHNFQVRA